MGLNLLEKKNFYFSFYERNGVPPIYSKICYKDNPNPLYSKSKNEVDEDALTIAIELFPSYLKFKIENHYEYSLKKIFRVKGYGITINNLESVEIYLKKHFKPNFRTALRRRLTGLETCFNISYKMFYGHIRQEEYERLMQALYTMLVRRFDQRNDENLVLGKWKDYQKNTYALINTKKASLFVIYDDKKPIQISLSYHYNEILFLAIPSYDIDYSKFGLGNISVLKLLEWCYTNTYLMMDMGFGAFDYKVKWCNEIYDFEHHLFYKKSSLMSRAFVSWINNKTRLINYLLYNGYNIYYHRFKDLILGNKKSDLLEFRKEKTTISLENLNEFKLIDHKNDNSYNFLKRALYDFLYTNLEHINDLEVYEIEKNKIYYFKGIKESELIIFKII